MDFLQRPKSIFTVLRIPPKETRYCTLCCKTSPGLDHHCSWLNTCIGERNYEAFYYLTLVSSFQTTLQTIIGILMCTLWHAEVKANALENWEVAVTALLWGHNLCAFSLGNSYVLLAGFHTYLLWAGTGTYDFILENGSEGLCARMLKCNCLKRSKRKKPKRSHVRANDDDDDSDVARHKAAASRLSRRGSPTTMRSPQLPTVADIAAAESLRGKWRGDQRTREDDNSKPSGETDALTSGESMTKSGGTPTVGSDKAHIEVSLNESEGIFREGAAAPAPNGANRKSSSTNERGASDTRLPSSTSTPGQSGVKTEL